MSLRSDALDRISKNAEQYQVALLDLRRAPVKGFQRSLWYRVLPDESIVALSGPTSNPNSAAMPPGARSSARSSKGCSMISSTTCPNSPAFND